MSMTFFPERIAFVTAGHPHPPNTQYRISVGVENWDGVFVPVYKIQMMYDGKVSGRKSPSYPVDSDDFMKVHTELMGLMANVKREKEEQREAGVSR